MKNIFNELSREYDAWFDKNPQTFRSEVGTIDALMPENNIRAIEIGVGTGRFALPLGIKEGLEPSPAMAEIAIKRGIKVTIGKAEEMPFDNESYDLVLMVTTLCFLDNPQKAMQEIKRILKPGGIFINANVNKNSFLGQKYEKKKDQHRFYKNARFYSNQDVLTMLKENGFEVTESRQTLFPAFSLKKLQVSLPGYSAGSFIAIQSKKIQ